MFKTNVVNPALLAAVKEINDETRSLEEKRQALLKDYGTESERGLTIEQKREFEQRLNEENLQELSKEKLKNYFYKSRDETRKTNSMKDFEKVKKRVKYQNLALKKIKKVNEENLQEISSKTLTSYVSKAGLNAINHANDAERAATRIKKSNRAAGNGNLKAATRDKHIAAGVEDSKRMNIHLRKKENRHAGLRLANKKLGWGGKVNVKATNEE